MLAAVEPGTGQVRRWRSTATTSWTTRSSRRTDSPPTRPSASGHQGQLPEHHQPADHRRRRHPRLPGRLDVQDLHHGGRAGEGHAADYTINAPVAVPVELHRSSRQRRPPARAQPLLPGQRQPERWPACATCGPASATRSTPTSCRWRSRSARRTRSTWRSGSASSSAPTAPDARRYELANDADQLGRVHPRASSAPRRWTWPTRTPPLAADGMYCEPMPVSEISDSGRQQAATSPTRAATQAVKPDVARAAADAARCPVGDHVVHARSAAAVGRAGVVHGVVGKPVAGKTGTTDGDKTAALVAMTKQLAVGRHPRRPGLGADQRDNDHNKVNTGRLRHAAGRDGGQAVRSTSPRRAKSIDGRRAVPSRT